jgi:hypothetical protein
VNLPEELGVDDIKRDSVLLQLHQQLLYIGVCDKFGLAERLFKLYTAFVV